MKNYDVWVVQPPKKQQQQMPPSNPNDRSLNNNNNNNSESNDCTNSTAYHISCVSTSDFLDTYKTDAKYFHPNNSILSKLEEPIDQIRITNPSIHTHTHFSEQQRNRFINYMNRSHDSLSLNAKNNQTSPASGSNENRPTSNVVGPLLYVDPSSEAPPHNRSNPNMIDTQNHTIDSVSK